MWIHANFKQEETERSRFSRRPSSSWEEDTELEYVVSIMVAQSLKYVLLTLIWTYRRNLHACIFAKHAKTSMNISDACLVTLGADSVSYDKN